MVLVSNRVIFHHSAEWRIALIVTHKKDNTLRYKNSGHYPNPSREQNLCWGSQKCPFWSCLLWSTSRSKCIQKISQYNHISSTCAQTDAILKHQNWKSYHHLCVPQMSTAKRKTRALQERGWFPPQNTAEN